MHMRRGRCSHRRLEKRRQGYPARSMAVGRAPQALASFERAARLSPIGPLIWGIQTMHANTLAALGRYEEAEPLAHAATRHQTATFWVYANWASILGNLGKSDKAQTALMRLLELRPDFSELFYDRLFAIAPEVRPMFPQDLKEQKKKLISMLATAVTNLHQTEKIIPAVQELGTRSYSSRPEPSRRRGK